MQTLRRALPPSLGIAGGSSPSGPAILPVLIRECNKDKTLKKLKYAALAGLLVLIVQQTVNSAQVAESIEVIQVSATRLDNSPIGASSVLTRAEISQINPASTIDLLARMPHVDVSQNSNSGGLSFISIRGGEFNFTLVTIDGIAVNDSTNSRGGGFDFNQINPAAIERIEVYRGGINTIYGGDAISGVINIVTRDATAPVLILELGQQKQLNGSLTTSHKINDDLGILASVSTRNKEVSSFENIAADQLLLKARYQKSKLDLAGLYTYNQSKVNSFSEDSGGQIFANPMIAEKRDSEQSLIGLNAKYKYDSQLSVNLSLSYLHREEEIDNPGIVDAVFSGIPASIITSEYKRSEIDVFSTIKLAQNSQTIIGANLRQQDGSNRGFLDFGFPLPVDYDFSQDISSAYIETKHQVNDWTFEASARYDSPEDFDNETTFRIGAAYLLSQKSSLFSLVNQGYKLPSFFALAHPLVGNSELKPERSRNFELGFSSQISDDIFYSLVYFENQFKDLVDFDAELFTNVNRNSVDTSGIELDINAKLSSRINLTANMRYLDIDTEQGVVLRKRPNISGNLRFEAVYENISASVYVDFRDDFRDSSIASGFVRLSGYTSLGISTTVDLLEQLQLTLNIENALGQKREDSVGFIQDDVEARFGVIYQF